MLNMTDFCWMLNIDRQLWLDCCSGLAPIPPDLSAKISKLMEIASRIDALKISRIDNFMKRHVVGEYSNYTLIQLIKAGMDIRENVLIAIKNQDVIEKNIRETQSTRSKIRSYDDILNEI